MANEHNEEFKKVHEASIIYMALDIACLMCYEHEYHLCLPSSVVGGAETACYTYTTISHKHGKCNAIRV